MLWLQDHIALLVGVALLALVTIARVRSNEPQLRVDLRGAMLMLLFFLVMRSVSFAIDDLLPSGEVGALHVVWMLALGFGLVRTVVSLALWVARKVQGRATNKILRDVVDFALYVLVALPILKSQLAIDVATLLGTSAVVSLVLGFALQDTLGNLFSGLSVQLESPFQVGDWITVGQHTGRVAQVGWRSTRIETFRKEAITLPNSVIAKEAVKNYTRGGLPIAIDLPFGVTYAAPPNQVKLEVAAALKAIPTVRQEPPPQIWVLEFDESAINFQIRYYVDDYAAIGPTKDEILARLWYRFGRAGIEIPFPQRVVTIRQATDGKQHVHQALLQELDLFSPFTEAERSEIAATARERQFGRGEHVIEEGAQGHTFFVVTKGTLGVHAGKQLEEISRLERGSYFGEMSLLTGEPRSATVIAKEDAVVLEIDRDVFARHFKENQGLATKMSEVLAARRAELDARNAANQAPQVRATDILDRLKQIFRVRE